MVLFTPFVWLLTKTTNLIVSFLGFSKKGNQEAITEQEIKEITAAVKSKFGDKFV